MIVRGGTLLALAAWGIFGAGCDQTAPTTPGATAAIGDTDSIARLDAASFATLVEGKRGRVLLINLWATWCSPCLKEIPELLRLQSGYQPKDLLVLGISLDTDQPETAVREFRDKHFPGFFTYLSEEPDWDTLVSVIDPAWDEVLPTSFVIDRNGELATIITGGKAYQDFAAAIAPLL